MRALLREERDVEVVSISKASARQMMSVLDGAGVTEAVTQPPIVLPADFLSSFEPFIWRGGEDTCSASAASTLATYLADAGVNMTDGPGPGYKVVDVHRFSLLTTQLGRLKLKGGTDAIIIPSAQDSDFATQQARVIPSAQDSDFATQQARVVIDFKSKKCDFASVSGQAQAELIAVSSLSHHDVLVVFTDLATFGHALRSEGSKLLVWKNLTPQEVIWLVADFLRNYCAPVNVAGMDDVRVPGDAASKQLRSSLSLKAHELLPRPSALLEQLEAFNTGHWEDYLHGRDLVLSAFESEQHLSYFS